MAALVIAEHDNHHLKPSSLSAVTAAVQIGGPVDVLIAGHECAVVADQAALISGVRRVLHADAPHYSDQGLAENFAALIAANASAYSHLLSTAGTFGRSLMPRVAALLDVAQVSDLCAIVSADTFIRPIYAGNALETVQATDAIKVLTVRASAFAPANQGEGDDVVDTIPAQADLGLSKFVSRVETTSDRPDLATARIVVAGGRGFGSAESFTTLLTPLAERLGAAVGASRAAVDAGYAPNDLQVGQTGKIVAPDLYIAVAISGAIQHQAGMKDAQVIVAINKDPQVPIFQMADYGLVADLFEALPQLLAELALDNPIKQP